MSTSATAFIYSLSSHINVTFEDFYINNVTFNTEAPFLYFSSPAIANYDTQNHQTSMIIKNGVVQNMFEKPKSTLSTIAATGNSLFVNCNGPTIFKVHNLTVTNCLFTNLSLITFTSNTNEFLNSFQVLPSMELTDITMKYTRNANFLLALADTLNISNVYLEGLSTKDATISYALFRVATGHLMNVYNVTANNVSGPLFQTFDVLAHNFSTISLNEMYTSQELDSNLRFIFYFEKVNSLAKKGLDPSRPRDTFFDNINLNGYTCIDGIDSSESTNDFYFIEGESIYGKVYLTNSALYNNLVNGFYWSLPYLEVDNLTINHDLDFSREQIPPHKGFYFYNTEEIVLKNSVFQNNQNFVLLHYDNSVNNDLSENSLTLENIIVLNNSAVFYDTDSPYSSLFIIYCPMEPVTVLFHNSYFYNNTILNGLINSLENYQAKIDLTNNTFSNNYATQAGAVFSSSNMRQTTSTFNLTNNTFTNNRCDQNGGIFYFVLTDYNMHLMDNTYMNNTASLSGGVGYAFRASFVFLEEAGVYLNNSVGSFGGAWYISLNTYQANLQGLKFIQTSFINSLAKQKGGSIYLENAGMTINQCTFHANQALVAGGDFYISIGKSINIIDTNFTASSAPEGSFLYSEEIDETLTLNNVQMTNIPSSQSILSASSGSLDIQGSVFENIKAPLFLLSGVTTSIEDTNFNQIYCRKTSDSFCLLKATSSPSDTIEIANSFFTNIYSNVDIISLSDCAQARLTSVTAQNILKLTQENLDQIFFLYAANVQTLGIGQFDFSQIGFSGVKAKSSNLQVQDSTFSNRLQADHRFLAQSINDAKLSQLIQFIILDSSNSTLTGISFIENSLNPLVNGGAVQILGTGGAHTLTDCIFENNHASNGGAMYVKGQASSISILNSQFDNNKATGNGGALTFSDQSVQNTLLINQSTFSQNTATLGGAIYLGTQALIVDFSPFIENNALRGGALATISSSQNTLVDLRQSSFVSNNASEGAALIALKEMNFVYSTSSFKQNTALYGGDVASKPTSLSLKIYSFEPYFLFIDNITAQDLLSDPSTVLIYDSAFPDTSESVAFISGSQPQVLFEVAVLDAFGQKMGQTNKAQGQFKISSSSSSSNLIGMLGSSTFTYTNSMAYIFKDFSVKGPFGTTVTLSIEGTYFSQTSNSIQLLPSLSFPILITKCSVGQTYDQSSAICSYCSSNTYSLADPFTAQTCQKCLDNAICLGGSIMYPAQGYWRIDESSENYIKCPQTDSCLGGSKDDGKKISLTGFCDEGYEGAACSSCTTGYARFGSSQSCANCEESKLYYVMFGGYLLIQTIAIIFSVKMNLKDSFKKSSVIRSTLIKIVIDFVQILTLISGFNLNFPSVVDYLYDGVTKIIPTNVDALSVDCFITLQKGNNKYIFFDKVLVILAEPFAYMIFALITWMIIFRIKRKPISKNPDFKYNFSLTIIVIVYILQPGLIKIMFELFSCKNYGSLEDPKYYLVYDVSVECWRHEHLVWALCIAIPALIIWLLAPFGILAFWTRDKDLRAAQRVQKAYSFIFKSYQSNALFWELAILIRKLILILISVFITSQYLQAYLGFFLLVLYYCSIHKISPYNNPQLNLAEAISIGSSTFILYSGLYFVRSEEITTVSYILFACDIISGLAFAAYIIYVFLKRNVVTIQHKITILSSKISTNLKINIHSHARKQALAPALLSPISLSSHDPNDSPTSSERFMSIERFTSTERLMLTDRPFSPLIKLHHHQSEEEISETRRENSDAELRIFSPSNFIPAGLSIFGSQQRKSSVPVDFPEIELPAEDDDGDDFQQLSEILQDEIRNSPRKSPENKIRPVFKFTK